MSDNKKINNILNKSIDIKDIEPIIYKTFAILIFLLPIIPEFLNVGVYSLKYTIFNFFTIATVTFIAFFYLYKLYYKTDERNFIKILKDVNIKLSFLDIIIILYFLLVILSCLFTKYGILNSFLGTNGRGEGVLTIFSYLATFYIFQKGFKYIKDLYKIAIFGAIVVSIYSIIQANLPNGYSQPFTTLHLQNVATGTMRSQNFLSSYVCIFLPTLCYIFIATKKYITLIPISLLFTTLIFSKTLGGYITCICIFLLIAIFSIIYYRQKKSIIKRILILTILFLVLFSTITIFKGNLYFNELKESKNEMEKLVNGDNTFGTLRMAIWEKVFMAISNNMILGVGPDSLQNELQKYDIYLTNGDNDILNKYILDKSHCEFLQIAVTTGLPSLILYLTLLVIICLKLFIMILLNLKKNLKEYKTIDKKQIFITAIFISIISYLMQSAINISVVQVAPIFWAILGMGSKISEEYKNNAL